MGIFKLNGVDYMGGGGGGGNANDMELTYDEYEELSEAEKTNGTNYFITDIDNFDNNTNFRPVIYSTREREIGVWTDGKPVYQKTIVYDTPFNIANDAWYTSSESYPDIELIANAWVINSAGAIYNGIIVVIENEKLVIGNQTKTQPINNLKYVILQYTKSIDQPGSGTWTPQGVPAEHYSTDEQIVGTWVDGSTLYQRSWILTIPNTSGAVLFPDTGIVNLDKIIETKYSFDGRGERSYTYWYTGASVVFDEHNSTGLYFYFGSSAYAGSKLYYTARYTKSS